MSTPCTTPADISALGTILAVWAHPDDETYLAGGLMAAAAAHGSRVVCVSATYGEHGTSDPARWPPERLAKVRRWEATAAMAVLGVQDHRWLELPDGRLAELGTGDGVDRVVAILDEVGPDTVVTFGPDGRTFHPDHRAVSRWVGAAWRATGARARLLHSVVADDHLRAWAARLESWGVYMTDERPEGVPSDRLAVDLRLLGDDLDQKVAALSAMHTQVAPALAQLGDDDFRAMVARESFVEASPDDVEPLPCAPGGHG